MPNETRTIDGAAARRIRESLGLTVGEVARLTGISRPSLSLIELGQRSPRLPVILALARSLGVHPDRITTVESARSA